MTHNYYTLFNKNSPEIYRVLDKQPSTELYKNYYDALSSKVWKGINITKISFILEKMIKFMGFESLFWNMEYTWEFGHRMTLLSTYPGAIVLVKKFYKEMFFIDRYLVKHGDFNVIMFLIKKGKLDTFRINFEVIVASFGNNDIRVFTYFLKHHITLSIAKDIVWHSESFKTKHLLKKINLILKKFENHKVGIINNILGNSLINKSVLNYVIQNYTSDVKINFYLYHHNFYKCTDEKTYNIIYDNLKVAPVSEANFYLNLMFINLIEHSKSPISPIFQKIHKRFEPLICGDKVYKKIWNALFLKEFDELQLRHILSFLTSKCRSLEFDLLTGPIFNNNYIIKKIPNFIHILFIYGVKITNNTQSIQGDDDDYETITKYMKAQDTLEKYINRKYFENREKRKEKHVPLMKEIVRFNENQLIKRTFPKHFTKFSWVKFRRTHPICILTPKSNGVWEKINLKRHFYPEIPKTLKSFYESEYDNGVNFVFGKYQHIIELRKLHIGVKTKPFYQVSNISTMKNIIESDYRDLEAYKAFNKGNGKKLWWPKILFIINEDFKDSYDELCELHYNQGVHTFDGFIFQDSDNIHVFKMKPKRDLTIDLLHINNTFYDKDNSVIDVAIDGQEPKNNTIYRCSYDYNKNKWKIKDERKDKKSPNSSDIIAIIVSSIKYPWSYDESYNSFVKNVFYYNNHKANKCNWNSLKPKHGSFIDKILKESCANSILNIGCGFRKFKHGINVDNDVFVLNENDQHDVFASMNDNWNSILQIKNQKKFDVVCFLNSINNINDFVNLRRNLETISIKNKTKLIIRYLNKDKLIECFKNKNDIITYDENYVKLLPGLKTIKYYYSHCNKCSMIEYIYSRDELKTYLGPQWKIINTTIDTLQPKANNWKSYLHCFEVCVFKYI